MFNSLMPVGYRQRSPTPLQAVNDSQAFRWLYFVAGFVPVYWVIWVSVDYAVQIFEVRTAHKARGGLRSGGFDAVI